MEGRHIEATTVVETERKLPPHIVTAIELSRVAAKRGDKILIVGGSAFDFLTNPDIATAPAENESGIRDVDVLFDEDVDARALIDQTEQEMKEKGLEMVKVESGSDLVKQVIKSDGGDYLFLKRLAVPVDMRIFEPIMMEVEGVQVPVVRPQTLYYLFRLFSGKYDREKDERRGTKLKDEFFDKYPIDFDDAYDVFDEYWRLRDKYYHYSMDRHAKWLSRHRRGIDEAKRAAPTVRKHLSDLAFGVEDLVVRITLPKKLRRAS